ncbi:MAG: NAD(P)-binding domain-containing protein [Planctomycetes bacterium]|nr:NAD(P)-binding domain-containing protein [Planctomycetota bacterium]
MTWTLLVCLTFALGLAVLGLLQRRVAMRRLRETLAQRQQARVEGSHAAQLQFPEVDLSKCLGCGTCVRACPEEGVLGLVHGQAVVVHGARCVGHGLCADACPTNAIAVTLGDLSQRRDIPVVDEQLEVVGTPGLFLAGEVTGYALVRTAIGHGAQVARVVASRIAARPTVTARAAAAAAARHQRSGGVTTLEQHEDPLDLCIVGAGPAGLSCALAAHGYELRCAVLERDTLGGTVAHYPRRKLVMTQPVDLPLYGRLGKSSYVKEELIEIWESAAKRFHLDVRTGHELTGLTRDADGVFTVHTDRGTVRARTVCLCLGRRGTPRRLEIPGEDLPKVAYSLLDAESYRGRAILVVGGGDSAVEAAIALAEQPGNRVTLSYRKRAFFRIKERNRSRLDAKVAAGVLRVAFESEPVEILPDRVRLRVADPRAQGGSKEVQLPNDEVFVFAGGIPPFDLLEKCAVSFDSSRRPQVVATAEEGTGILHSLMWAVLLTLGTIAWCFAFRHYYDLPWVDRPDSGRHGMLAPTGLVGLTAGVAATALIVLNLVYVLRRARLGQWISGSLQNWLSIHVVTGILALLFLVVHAGMLMQPTPGGLAFAAVLVLVVSGGIGRYFYAFLPKAANGRTLAQDEAKEALSAAVAELDEAGRGLGDGVQAKLQALVAEDRWGGSLPRRIAGLFGARRREHRLLEEVRVAARTEELATEQIDRLVMLARNLRDAGLRARHYEDLRGLVASWRFVHRWLALVMVMLAVNHIVTALRFARLW